VNKISWWQTNFGELEIEHVVQSMRNRYISQGKVTTEFELYLSEFLEVEHVIAVNNGSSAILIALMAAGISPNDEVIIPNRTWIATAHAVHLLGAKVVLVDTEKNRPIIDATLIEEKITSKTKAIIPVHMNGRSCDMQTINALAKKYKLFVIEDAAQAIASKNPNGYLGTQSDIGCFSLSVAKTISTGQGGFAVTNNSELATKIRAIRTQGVENVKDPQEWPMPGFNFRFSDIYASIGIEQLKRLPERLNHLRDIYEVYDKHLKDSAFRIIPVDIHSGEVPVYSEFLVENREIWTEKLADSGVETRPFYPAINSAHYLQQTKERYINSEFFSNNGIYLPSGPGQKISSIKESIKTIQNIIL
jgi:dTDP-4-amino-4,6-dideoxygalactose transaminase